MKMSTMSLRTRRDLALAADALKSGVAATERMPMVFVTRQVGKAPEAEQAGSLSHEGSTTLESRATAETKEQAELRRERVEAITRRAPEVVITRRWIHTASHFDGQEAVVVRLPLMVRLRNWLRGQLD